MWFLHDKKFAPKAYAAFGIVWWVWFGAKVVTDNSKYTPPFTFTCDKIIIYNREKFYKKINRAAELTMYQLNIDTENFKDIPLKTIAIFGIKHLAPRCKVQNLSYEQKIIYYILGIDVYEYIKDLKYGRIIESDKYELWEKEVLPIQLKQYREFLGLEEKDVEVVEKAYNQLIQTGRYP